jgi:ketosteroid isomerase-like protein
MSQAEHDLAPLHAMARAYFAAVTAGDLPDALCCDDMTAWITTGGTMSKGAYQHVIRLLARMCATPIEFTIDAITAEDDRVLAEAHTQATLVNGELYENTYVFAFRIRDGKFAHIAEHYNALVAQEKLVPLMKTMT